MDSMKENDSFFVIEEMKKSVDGKYAKVGNLKEPIDSHRRHNIARVHIVGFSSTGVYICRDLGKFPHYMVSRENLQSHVLSKCDRWHIPTKVHSSKKRVSRCSIMCIWQLGDEVCDSTSKDEVDHVDAKETVVLLDQLSIDCMKENLRKLAFDTALADTKGRSTQNKEDLTDDRLRGARQSHFGYTSNYSLQRRLKAGKVSVRPSLIGGEVPDAWKTRFAAMTKIGDDMFYHDTFSKLRPSNGKGLYDDPGRNVQFAKEIHQENKLEALTYSVTSSTSGNLLKIHVDQNNDETEKAMENNYNFMLCAWQTDTEEDGSKCRNAMLGYSRRSLSDLLTREKRCIGFCDDHMSPWLDTIPEWRINVNPTTNSFFEHNYGGAAKVDEDKNVYFPPTLNKHATFISGFADRIVELKNVYEKKNKKKMTVEKQLEIILPIVFFPSAQVYRQITDAWISRQGFMEQEGTTMNLTMVYIRDATELNGSVNKGGKYPRHQPTINFVPDEHWVTVSLRCLREAVIHSVSRKTYSFKCMMAQVTKIHHVGPLLCQHLIHSMSLTGLVHPMYGAKAEICDGTLSAKRLLQIHHIPKSNHPCLLEFVGARYAWLPYIAENAICKSGQKKLCNFRDVIYGSQQYILWVVRDDEGVYRIAYVDRDWSKGGTKEVRHKLYSPYDKRSLIFEPKSTSGENAWKEHTANLFWWSCKSSNKRSGTKVLSQDEKKASKTRRLNPSPVEGHIYDEPSPPPVPQPTNWLLLDRAEMKKMTAEYEKDLRRNVFFQAMKISGRRDDFGGTFLSSSLALRTAHEVGAHYTVPLRNTTPTVESQSEFRRATQLILGSTKVPTHLLSMGVTCATWDLHRMAEKCLIATYKSQVSSSDALPTQMHLKVSTFPVRARVQGSPRGRTYFVPLAQLCNVVMSPKGSKIDKKTHTLREFYIKRGVSNTKSSGILHEGIVRGDFFSASDLLNKSFYPMAYTKVQQAITSMLWYIVWTNSRSHEWIPQVCNFEKWCSGRQSGMAADDSILEYMLVSLKTGKGHIFCTLIRHVNTCIWMRLESESGKKEAGTFNTAIFRLCEVDPFQGSARVASLTPDPIMIKKITDNDAHSGLPDSIVQCNEERIPACSKEDNAKEKERKSRTLHRKPILLDPIDLTNDMEFQSMTTDLHRWDGIWGKNIDGWSSTYVARMKNPEMADKYWHPPGFPTSFHGIRSKSDLRSFLDHCLRHYEKQLVNAAGESVFVDYDGAVRSFEIPPRVKRRKV